mgnify:CR=1 FL=1
MISKELKAIVDKVKEQEMRISLLKQLKKR